VLTAKRTLEIYNWHTGAFVRSWRVTRGATALDAYGGLAVYVQGSDCCHPHKLHVLGLATGRDVVLDTTMPLSDAPSVQLEAPGVVYARTRRTLAFVPFKRLLADALRLSGMTGSRMGVAMQHVEPNRRTLEHGRPAFLVDRD
jgi:hypothetical protein